MISSPSRHKLPSSGAIWPSDIAVRVNIKTEFNLMAVYPIIECFSRDLAPKYCQYLQPCTVYTAPPFFVQTLPGRVKWRLLCLPLHLQALEIIPTFITLNIYIGLYLPESLVLTWLWSYEMFEVLLIITMNKCVGLQRILTSCLVRDTFPSWLARAVPLKEGVL
jgi:hypothetical protein